MAQRPLERRIVDAENAYDFEEEGLVPFDALDLRPAIVILRRLREERSE